MGLLSSIKSTISKGVGLVKDTGKVLKDTFAPSEEVGAARRKEVFGTESKAVAAGVITVAAAAAIAAPTAAGVAVLKKAGSTIASSSLATKVVGTAAVITTAGAVSKNPKIATKAAAKVAEAPSNLFNYGQNIGELTKNPSLENLKTVASENPYLSALTVAAGGYVVGKGLSSAASGLMSYASTQKLENAAENLKDVAEQAIGDGVSYLPTTTKMSSESQIIPVTADKNISTVPLTPATQVVGKSVSTTTKKRKRAPRSHTGRSQSQSLRVNIFNQSKHLYTKRAHPY